MSKDVKHALTMTLYISQRSSTAVSFDSIYKQYDNKSIIFSNIYPYLIVFIFYATFIYDSRPSLKSVVKSFLALQVYLVFVYIINSAFNSNYFYINGKPDVTTLLDSFGDWPYYILVGELVIIPFFLIIYLPFYLLKKRT